MPGPLKVAVFRARYERGEALFAPDDVRWEDVQVRRKVTKRSEKKGNPLEAQLIAEKEAVAAWRADMATRRKNRR